MSSSEAPTRLEFGLGEAASLFSLMRLDGVAGV